ncbi:TetR/AcrR family transcriptional regulator [Embleya sp. NPDC005575]|uniref:TetR/AcrR family transcriptional regulator n=1 Tax=Embleya sp. NPDC005575 TaxID=3156892 RepID=UPI0033A79704
MSDRTGARGPYARGVARRQEIVHAALEVFATRGYDAVSLREIAAQVGLSHTGLRHHFASKEELLTAVLRYKDELTLTPDEPVDVSGIAWVRASRDVVALNARQPLLIRLFATLSVQATDPAHPAHAYFVERYRIAREIAAGHLAQARDDGDIAADVDAEHSAELMLAAMDGLQVQWLLEPDRVDMVAAYGQFLDRFLAVLAVPLPEDGGTAKR